MNGYKIVYKDDKSKLQDTFFGDIMTNLDIPKENYIKIVKSMFHNAHPNCKIVSCKLCKLEDYTK